MIYNIKPDASELHENPMLFHLKITLNANVNGHAVSHHSLINA